MKTLSLMLSFLFSVSVFADCQKELSKRQSPMDDHFLAYHHCSAYSRAVASGVYSENAIVGGLSFIIGLATIFPKWTSIRKEVTKTCETIDKFVRNYSRELKKIPCRELQELRVEKRQVDSVTETIANCTQDGWNGHAYDDFVSYTKKQMELTVKTAQEQCR